MGVSRVESPQLLASVVVPLTFRLVVEEGRPRIEVAAPDQDGALRWVV